MPDIHFFNLESSLPHFIAQDRAIKWLKWLEARRKVFRCDDMPGSCWRVGVLNVRRSAQSLAERCRWTLSFVPPAVFKQADTYKQDENDQNLITA